MKKFDAPDNYAVGYGRPPKEFQFRPGTSGNAKGRPKRARTPEKAFEDAMLQTVQFRVGGRQKKGMLIDLIANQIANAAAKGHIPSANLALSFVRTTEVDQALKNLDLGNMSDRQLDSFISHLEKRC